MRLGYRHFFEWLSVAGLLLVPGLAAAQNAAAEINAAQSGAAQPAAAQPAAPEPATAEPKEEPSSADSLPGSPRPDGLGMSPEAPRSPPAPGGRAPSFGAPTDPDAWSFRIGGRISAYAQIGIGRTPADQPNEGLKLHTPPVTVGRSPFWAGPGGTLTFQYGNQTVTGFVSLEASLTGKEWEGYYRAENGPRIRTAYVLVTPAPIGDLRLSFQIGSFPNNYGAPGPWGWGVFGPVLAVHGYGGTAVGTYNLTPDTQLHMEYGLTAVSAADEGQVGGTFTDWPEKGLATLVNHAHLGLSLKNKYFAKLHLARAQGRTFQTYLADDPAHPRVKDGHWDVAALELRWVGDPYGQLGITPVYWNFQDAASVHNGIWWGIDWTAGSREMNRKFLGPNANANGKLFAVSAEYNFSLSRILKHPQPFDGNGPDLRVSLAVMPYWTLSSADPAYDGTNGYYVGAVLQHVMLSWLSAGYMLYGESRDSSTPGNFGETLTGRWVSYSGTVGLLLHSDWQAQDRIVLAYSRYFYSNFADLNPERPLDRDVFTLGASVAF